MLVKVKSSNVRAVDYDKKTKTLLVVFIGRGSPDRKYLYKGVPENVAVELVKASSVGTYLNAHIKDKYESEGPL